MMGAHALATFSFYWSSRLLGKPRLPSAVFALLFGLSYFIFHRRLAHITVGYCWHVPLCWVVVCYGFSARGIFKNRRRVLFSLAVAVITGLQNPYYTLVFAQFLGLAFVMQALRRHSWSPVWGTVAVAAVLFGAFLSMQADTLIDRAVNHRGSLSVQRYYSDVELYSLKPLDLILPLHWQFPPVENIAHTYGTQRVVSAEFPMGFLGVVAAAGTLLLAGTTFRDLALRRGRLSDAVRKYAVPAVWIVFLSMVGGLVGMASLLSGAYFFRATNRFSIFIVALLMFFWVDVFTYATRRRSGWIKGLAAALPLLAGVLEIHASQVPRGAVEGAGVVWESYRQFVSGMEGATGPGAMFFNLPVVEFPETTPQYQEDSYIPLLLYAAQPSSLRFSYGNMRGDYRDTWQRTCAQLPPEKMVAELRRYGFRGVVVSCNAYPDHAKDLLASLAAAAGRPPVVGQGQILAYVPFEPPPPGGRRQRPACHRQHLHTNRLVARGLPPGRQSHALDQRRRRAGSLPRPQARSADPGDDQHDGHHSHRAHSPNSCRTAILFVLWCG